MMAGQGFTLAGIICPLATPLARGRVDLAVLDEHVTSLLGDIDGLFVLGTSGEHPLLPIAEEDALVQRVATQMAGAPIPLLVGVGEQSAARTLARVRALRASGPIAAFVVTAPTYFPADDAALVAYYKAIADESWAPIVVYNVPQNTVNAIGVGVVAELSQHPNIVGIKDSAGDFISFLEMLQYQSESFSVLQGREQMMAASLLMGARGMVSSMANFAPRLLRSLASAVESGDMIEIRNLQRMVSNTAQVFEHGHWVSALKTVLQECGFAVGPPTMPLPSSTKEESRRIVEVLARTPDAMLTRSASYASAAAAVNGVGA